MESRLKISGMHCASCEKVLAMAVDDVAGAKMLKIDHKNGEAKVEVKDAATLAQVKKAIEAEGYKIA